MLVQSAQHCAVGNTHLQDELNLTAAKKTKNK